MHLYFEILKKIFLLPVFFFFPFSLLKQIFIAVGGTERELKSEAVCKNLPASVSKNLSPLRKLKGFWRKQKRKEESSAEGISGFPNGGAEEREIP